MPNHYKNNGSTWATKRGRNKRQTECLIRAIRTLVEQSIKEETRMGLSAITISNSSCAHPFTEDFAKDPGLRASKIQLEFDDVDVDSATCHISNETINLQKIAFAEHIISCRGPVVRLSRLWLLMTLDYFFE